jgi:hypothetical protein
MPSYLALHYLSLVDFKILLVSVIGMLSLVLVLVLRRTGRLDASLKLAYLLLAAAIFLIAGKHTLS